jgi:predicted nucleic acid-binding protein
LGFLIRRPNGTVGATLPGKSRQVTEAGQERISTAVAALVDTNILVYRFDNRFPEKQKIATDILRRGILENSVRVPHQAIVEFIAAVTRPLGGHVIFSLIDALREAEELLLQFTVLYPNEAIVRNAIRGCAAYQLSWFDAHLWSYAEHYGLSEIITEDLQHERLYGTVRAVNPFVASRKSGRKPE